MINSLKNETVRNKRAGPKMAYFQYTSRYQINEKRRKSGAEITNESTRLLSLGE